MQGSKATLRQRVEVTGAMAVAFIVASLSVFWLFAAVGEGIAAVIPLETRRAFAVIMLSVFAAVDLLCVKRGTYCILGIERQTPKSVLYRFGFRNAAGIWGFDTGLAITTIRVSALTWGALLLCVVAPAVWWSGLVYGCFFIVPLVFEFWGLRRVGQASISDQPTDPGLVKLLDQRVRIQYASAFMLSVAAVLLGCIERA